jgi:hypothetical protein
VFIKVIESRPTGRHYVYRAEAYRTPEGKNRQRLIERVGVLEDMQGEEPGVLERLRAEARQGTAQRQARVLQIPADLDAPADLAAPVNLGGQVADAVLGALGAVGACRQATRGARMDVAKALRVLVLGHLVFAGSKARTIARQGELFGVASVSKDSAYRALTHIASAAGAIQKAVHERVSHMWGRDASLVFYDVTNYYFTSDVAGGLRRRGCSKQHQPTPIVQMGLFMDSAGIPICYKLFDGNIPDCVTLTPILHEVKAAFDLGRIVVVGDKAMNSAHNTATLAGAGDGWMFSKSARACSKATRRWLLDPAGWATDPDTGARSKSKIATRTVEDHDGNKRTVTEKIVARWSPQYAARDAHTRAEMLAKAKALTQDPAAYKASTRKGAKKYIQQSQVDPATGEVGGEPTTVLSLDRARAEADALLDGLYMIHTSETALDDRAIAARYHDLWQIEENFRVSKTDLNARPVYVWTDAHIHAHFLICFLALTITRVLEHLTAQDLSANHILTAIRTTTAIDIHHGIYRLIRHPHIAQLEQALGAQPLDRSWATIADLRAHHRALTRAIKQFPTP